MTFAPPVSVICEKQPDRLTAYDVSKISGSNFGSAGRSRLINEIFADIRTDAVVWQLDVYQEAAQLAKRLGLVNVIDIGCGNGRKLRDIAADFAFNTVGVDFHASMDAAIQNYPDGTWIEANIQDINSTRELLEKLAPYLPAVIILSDVIEHLPDVRPCLKLIRDLISKDENSFAIFSTPDRSRQNREDTSALPDNKAHVREWSLAELASLVSNFGFEISRLGWTRANQYDEYFTTSFIQAGFSNARHVQRIANTFKAPRGWNPRHILITSEMHGYTASGGIGSFIIEQKSNYGENECAVLVASEGIIANAQRPVFALVPDELTGHSNSKNLPMEDRSLLAVETLYYLFPRLESVQFQEYQGIGFRIAQAKRAGILPKDLSVVVHCHGGTHYLENGRRNWLGQSHMVSSVKEKISIENADVVYFPSVFLKELYDQSGLDFRRHHTAIRRYPYQKQFFSELSSRKNINIDTLIFFGKRTLMKGYGLFMEALRAEAFDELYASGLRRIIIIGPSTPETDQWRSAFDAVSERFEVIEHSNLIRDEAIACMSAEADRSFVVMPYIGDNYPFSVFDAMASGCLPILVNAGGVPEMLPPEFLPRLVANADPLSLRNKFVSLLSLSKDEISRLINDLAKSSNERQIKINDEAKAPIIAPQKGNSTNLTCAIIIPYFNTQIYQIENLLWSISHQLRRPDDIVVLDDSSTPEMSEALDEVVAKWRRLGLPLRSIRHQENKGLAAARNTALAAIDADITVNVDSDDVVLPNFLADIINGFENNSDVDAVVPYLLAFDDKADFTGGELNGYVYRPLGDGLIASQTDNLLGHANSGFRTETIRDLGGWDTMGRAMWEDYALFLRLVSLGKRIAIVPRAGVLYRVTPKSMARSYARWPAMRLQAKAIDGLPRFEAFRLQAALREMEALELNVSTLRDQLAQSENSKNNYFIPKIEELSSELTKVTDGYNDAAERLNRLWTTKLEYFEPTINAQKDTISSLTERCAQLERELHQASSALEAQTVLNEEIARLHEIIDETTSRLDQVWNVKINYFEPLVLSQTEEIDRLKKKLQEIEAAQPRKTESASMN